MFWVAILGFKKNTDPEAITSCLFDCTESGTVIHSIATTTESWNKATWCNNTQPHERKKIQGKQLSSNLIAVVQEFATMLSQHQRCRNIQASYLYLQVPHDTRELGDVFYKKIGLLYTRYKDWPKEVQSISPGLLSSQYWCMLCILKVSRFLEKPECAENLSMCQGKAPCAVFLNVEELIESPKKLLVRQKNNTISTNKEEKSTKEASLVSHMDAVNKSP